MTRKIQAVERALRILQDVADAPTPPTLTEISGRVSLHVSTAHRMLSTLRSRGFIEQDAETSRYRIGLEAFRVGNRFAAGTDFRARLRPVLEDLAIRSGETANLVIRQSLEAVYIDHVVGTQVAKLFTWIGQSVPLHCTAVGKVLLAGMTPRETGNLPAGLSLIRYTPQTITSRRALWRELAIVRAAGFATDREEHEVGVACIAAPVRDATGAVAAAMGISGPAGRVLAHARTLGGEVRACAAAASRALGYQDVRPRPTPATGRSR
jgi:DNA-binding IclR family transcriptional regulator